MELQAPSIYIYPWSCRHHPRVPLTTPEYPMTTPHYPLPPVTAPHHPSQAQLHAGDPDNEGVVWPQIAEISLLGALGCGRWLIELLLDELEAEGSPYLYVVTQACPQYT